MIFVRRIKFLKAASTIKFYFPHLLRRKNLSFRSYDSDGMSDGGVPSLERLIKTFEGVERIQLPYPGNPQIITVNSGVSLSKIFGTNIETNGNGSIRVKIPNAGMDESRNLFNGTWDSTTPKIKLTKCEEGNRTPEIDNCIASV